MANLANFDWHAVFKLITTLGAALFVGGALYISVVEHPARMRASPDVALAEFRQMYRRAAPWQASAAAICLLGGAVASFLTQEWVWFLGGLAVGVAIPFTLLVMMPTNRRLLGTPPPPEDEAIVLLERWGQLHWTRSILSTLGLLVLLSKAFLR